MLSQTWDDITLKPMEISGTAIAIPRKEIHMFILSDGT